MKLTKNLLIFLCILPLLALTACVGGAEPTQSTSEQSKPEEEAKISSGPKTMFIGMVNPPMTFVGAQDASGLFIGEFLFDSLLDMVEPLEFVPKLADGFETTDNQTYTIKLNQQAEWTDGQPVTAEDVAFTLEWIANPNSDSNGKSIISFIEGLTDQGAIPEGQTTISGLKLIDDHTLAIKAKSAVDPNYVKELLGSRIGILPKHVLKDIAPDKLTQHPFTQNPNVTSGAFKFVKYEKDQYVELEANKSYYKGTPKLDKIFVKIMPAPNLVAQLQSGEIHMNAGRGIGIIPVQDYETVEKMENVTTKAEPQIAFQLMMMNTETITDKLVRQAIAYGVNRKLIVDKLLNGYGEVIDGPYTSIHPYLNKDLEPIPHDPKKAKQLLQEAGWDGSKVLELVVPVGNAIREQAANIIAENLNEVGIAVNINRYDFPTVMQKGLKREFDLLLMGFPLFVDPDVSLVYGGGAYYNFTGYNNPEANELLEKGKVETDPAQRREIYDRLQEIWQEDMPFLTTYSEHHYSAVSKKVKAGEPKIFGMLSNVHEWDIEE